VWGVGFGFGFWFGFWFGFFVRGFGRDLGAEAELHALLCKVPATNVTQELNVAQVLQ